MNTQKPPLESKVVAKIMAYLKSRGGFWFKSHGSPMQLAGIPDIIGCYRGRFVAFEVKRGPGYPPTKLQEYMIGRITKAGGIALVIHSVEQAEAELDRIDGIQEA